MDEEQLLEIISGLVSRIESLEKGLAETRVLATRKLGKTYDMLKKVKPGEYEPENDVIEAYRVPESNSVVAMPVHIRDLIARQGKQ